MVRPVTDADRYLYGSADKARQVVAAVLVGATVPAGYAPTVTNCIAQEPVSGAALLDPNLHEQLVRFNC